MLLPPPAPVARRSAEVFQGKTSNDSACEPCGKIVSWRRFDCCPDDEQADRAWRGFARAERAWEAGRFRLGTSGPATSGIIHVASLGCCRITCRRVRVTFGRPRPLPGYPTAPALYPVSVRQLRASPPASFPPCLARRSCLRLVVPITKAHRGLVPPVTAPCLTHKGRQAGNSRLAVLLRPRKARPTA